MSKFIKNPSLHTTDEFKIQSSTSQKPELIILNTNDNNKEGRLKFNKQSSSPADGDYLGRIQWFGNNDNDDSINYATITSSSVTVADGNETGKITFSVLADETFDMNTPHVALTIEGTTTDNFVKTTIQDTLHLGTAASGATLQMGELADHLLTATGMGQIWVKNNTPCDLYYTDDTGQDVRITNDGALAASGGTSRWSHSFGGYKTSNSSSSYYYFQYYPNNNSWNNAESSPTTLNAEQDIYSAEWIAPADGILTKIDIFVKGGSDDCQFYVFKGSCSESGSTTATLTQIGASGACGIDSTSKTFYQTATFSSSNTFSAGDGLWVMMKKEAHSTSTSFYFSGTISGEYT